ncbi:MAG TPA: Calx-beta domain-containing protein [Acidimicrobiales bacterium]|nr:Calx-beta domain-containing protein [Acidimicrobiales bacterium]
MCVGGVHRIAPPRSGAAGIGVERLMADGWRHAARAQARRLRAGAAIAVATIAGASLAVAAAPARAASGDVTISPSSVRTAEGDGSVTLTVRRSGVGLAAGSVTWRTRDGSAHAGSDYRAAGGTLTFAVGENAKQVTVTILDDRVTEADETFEVELTGAGSGGAVASVGPPAVVTIADDDAPTAGATRLAPAPAPPPSPGAVVTTPPRPAGTRRRAGPAASDLPLADAGDPATALHLRTYGGAGDVTAPAAALPTAELPLALLAALLLGTTIAKTWFAVRSAEAERALRPARYESSVRGARR